jgi:hypothetical protein
LPRATANKLYRTFTKGLITEAGPLTYPENASIDELNTVIKVKGSRSRRLGLDYEPSSLGSTISGLSDTDFISEFSWKGVGNDSSVNFLVIQIDSTLHFYNMDAVPITNDKKSFTVNLNTYVAPFATTAQVAATPCQMAAGKGWLFIASPYIDPVLVEYTKATDTITAQKVIIKIRDFDGIEDNLGNEDQPTSITNEHYYNLRNQGWVQPGPNGVVDGTPTTPFSGDPPPGSSSGTGGGGYYLDDGGLVRPQIP